ncbi:MAG: ABC transporter substrate-binding protein [Candidatus Rokuibacteriota bacterium]
MKRAVLQVGLSALLGIVLVVARAGEAAAGPGEIKGTLTVAYATLFDETLNPLFGPAPPKIYYDVMYEYLLYNEPQTWKLEPGLAERWSMSQDGKRWVFFLRKGVTFSDGTEFTAEDVKFSMELLTRKDARWPFRATFLRAEPRVLDRYTVAFDGRDGGLADLDQTLAAFIGLPIVSRAHYEKVGDKGYDERPVGTGPYRFKARRAGDSMTFEARPDGKTHWRVQEQWAKHGAFKEIVFRKVPELATRVAMLRTGQADIVELSPEVIREVERAKLHVVRSADSYVPMVTFHGVWLPSKPSYDPSLPWLKKEVRQALSLALDRKQIGERFYFGTAAPAAGPHWFHPGTLGWNPAWKPDPYDPARAKKLLADEGYPNGFTIPLRLFTMPGVTELPALGEAIAGYWEKIGVKADLIRTEWAVHRPDLVKRTFKGATVFRGFPQPEPVTVWRLVYHSQGDFGQREDPFVDSTIDALASTVNVKEREALGRKLGDFLLNDAATLPIVSASYLYGTNPRTVKGWQPTRAKYPDRFEWAAPAR